MSLGFKQRRGFVMIQKFKMAFMPMTFERWCTVIIGGTVIVAIITAAVLTVINLWFTPIH